MMKLHARPILATALAALTAIGPISPVFAQEPAQAPAASNPAAASQGSTIAPVTSLELSKHDFTRGPKSFPNLIKAYKPIDIERPNLTNSPRIDQLIQDGKLSLSLQDAVELALENSVDIAVQRYYPWLADLDVLKAKSGGGGRGIPGADFGQSSAAISGNGFSIPSYDPILTNTLSVDSRSIPVNNPFLAGTGLGGGGTVGLTSHSSIFNTGYSQSFTTGTSLGASWNNTRSSSSAANFSNPTVQSSLSVGFSQQLLNGFGSFIGKRNILIANNNRKIADLAFAQQAITTVTNTVMGYWELVYARENVKVQEQAVAVAEKLYNDNKKQLEIGTMAPLDVTRAESELATDRQNLIVAKTVQLQDEQILKNAISKNPLAENLVNVEIIPTDLPAPPVAFEASSFEQAIQEAFAKRPDLQEQFYNLKNADIDVRATKNALLPTLTLSGQYSSSGLAGNTGIFGPPQVVSNGVPIVDANGNPVLVNGAPVFESTAASPRVGTNAQGFGQSQDQIFHNRFPDYFAQLSLTLPLRNRSAQADSARAILAQRQLESVVQQLKNAALLDVRNTYIALEQDRARVEAASKARELQKQTFEAEQKKYQLGASTVYNVILTQRDYVTAQGTELRALADLVEAKANHERAVGRTLEINHVNIADAKTGVVERETLIPGTVNGQVVGTEKLFKTDSEK